MREGTRLHIGDGGAPVLVADPELKRRSALERLVAGLAALAAGDCESSRLLRTERNACRVAAAHSISLVRRGFGASEFYPFSPSVYCTDVRAPIRDEGFQYVKQQLKGQLLSNFVPALSAVAHLGPEGDGVLLVGEPAPAGLNLVTIDRLVDKSGVEVQRLLACAVNRPELRAHDAVQRMRQLLESPIRQVPVAAALVSDIENK